MKGAVRLVVQGRVQGAGFRWFVQHEAVKRALCGWVKNLPGGEGEAYVEGEKDEIMDFIKQVRKGHSFSRVTQVITEWHDHSGRYTGFEITY
jgi:acylphosphatase